MNRKKLALLFGGFEKVYFGKDVFLVPYYLGKIYNMDAYIVYPEIDNFRFAAADLRGVTLIPLRGIFAKGKDWLRELSLVFYILANAKKVDVLMELHIRIMTSIIGILYKMLHPSGKLYIKCDGISYLTGNKKRGCKKIKEVFYRAFLKKADLITIETTKDYSTLRESGIFGVNIKDKISLMHNGFDEEQFLSFNIRKKTMDEKENIIITVGRLGSAPKNSGMLLTAASQLDLKNWKVVLIGPIEKKERDFQKDIDSFFQLHPALKEKIIFTGAIYDKKELWEWYNRAKVFVLTSRWENWALVLDEALYFRNYIVSTNVGSAEEIIGQGYGEITPQEDANNLSKVLQLVIDGSTKIDEQYRSVDWDSINNSWEKYIREATTGFF